MTALRPWSERREREAIVLHLARCSFCRALLAYSRRRRDRELLDATDRLAWEHAENDAEREQFSRRVRRMPASAEHQDLARQAAAETRARDVAGDEDGLAHVLRASLPALKPRRRAESR